MNYIVVFLCFITTIHAAVIMDFDSAMQKAEYPNALKVTRQIVGIDGQVLYDLCKRLYEKNSVLLLLDHNTHKIPKIIHQIWLGSPVPDVFKEYMRSWTEFHPEWTYILWDDDSIEQLHLDNKFFYDAVENYGHKSDIARWEILYRFGGVYVDIDFECLRPLDELLVYDFFVGLQPLDSQFLQLNNALVGSVKGHPIVEHCITTIAHDWKIYRGAPQRTGPVHFTRSWYALANQDGYTNMIFPASYFYPLSTRATYINKSLWKKQGSYAVHWWAKSWMPKEYRQPKYRIIDNQSSTYSWND